MGRRGVLALLASAAAWLGLRPAMAQAPVYPDPAAFDPKILPFPVVAVAGVKALAEWERIRAEGKVWPVVIGDDLHGSHLMDALSYETRSPADLIAAAASVSFPKDLLAEQGSETRAYLDSLRAAPDAIAFYETKDGLTSEPGSGRPVTNAELLKGYENEPEGPEVGDWPARPDIYPPLGSILDYRTGKPMEKVYIALLPTTEGATAPAWLKFGGWNDCPPVEQQIAALRSLRDRYGAELVACTHDTIDLRVARRPASRDEALSLARELYAYCGDSVDQGHETLSRFAAALMASDWWTFWWD